MNTELLQSAHIYGGHTTWKKVRFIITERKVPMEIYSPLCRFKDGICNNIQLNSLKMKLLVIHCLHSSVCLKTSET